MSYILDALKKSEQARGSRKIRGLLEEPLELAVTSSQPHGSSRRWLYLVALILFLNVGFFGFWLRLWQSPGTSPRPQSPPGEQLRAKSAPAIPPQPLTQVNKEQEAKESEPVEQEKPAPNPPASAGASGASAVPPVSGTQAHETVQDQSIENKIPPGVQEAAQGVKAEPALADLAPSSPSPTAPGISGPAEVAVKKPEGPSMPQNPKAAGTKKGPKTANLEAAVKNHAAGVAQPMGPAAGSGIISDIQPLTELRAPSGKPSAPLEPKWHELAPQTRDAIPNMSVSMLVYSKTPGSRWININGSKRREGEEIAAGLKVEEITPEGAIFSYQGHRFYKGVVGD